MVKKSKLPKTHLSCPYCDKSIAEAQFPYCEACKVEVFTCPSCNEPVPRDKEVCPHCGASLKASAKGG